MYKGMKPTYEKTNNRIIIEEYENWQNPPNLLKGEACLQGRDDFYEEVEEAIRPHSQIKHML